ncbi:extracellular solute-binding protein [Vagococcus entomophilus]|nr:extracellular solute-binding protein [Vagococcus entomophilus]
MGKMRKFLIGFVVLSSALLVTGCGGGKETKNAKGDLIVTIGRQTIQNSKLPKGDTYENNAYTKLVEKKLGVELKSTFEANGEDYDRQVSLAIASGDMPDLMVVNSYDELKELVDNDLIEDLTNYYDKNASKNIKEIYESYDSIPLKEATFDDKLMAIPGTSVDDGPGLVWIRKDWLDKLGIKLDADGNGAITLEELKATAKTFVDKNPDNVAKPVGLALNYWLAATGYGNSTFTSSTIMHSFGAFPRYYLADKSGKVYYGSTTNETKKALTYLKSWYDEGLLDPQFGTRTFDDITAMLINGETGIAPGPWHLPGWNLSQVKESNPEADFVPYAIENQNGDGKINATSDKGAGSFIVVKKGFAHPELALKIVNLIYDKVPNSDNIQKEYPDLYKYSQLDVDGTARPFNVEIYDANSGIEDSVQIADAVDGKININDLTKPTDKTLAQSIKKVVDNPKDPDINDWNKYITTYVARAKTMAIPRELGILNEIVPPKFHGIKALEKNGAQLTKLEEETFIKFVTGEESLANFDQFIANWKKQGGSDVLKEMQKVQDSSDK